MTKSAVEIIKDKSKSKIRSTHSLKTTTGRSKSKIQPRLFEKSKKPTKAAKETTKEKSKTIRTETKAAAAAPTVTEKAIPEVPKIETVVVKPSSQKLELFVTRKSPVPVYNVEEQKSKIAMLKAEAEAAAIALKKYEEPKFFETIVETKVEPPSVLKHEQILAKTTIILKSIKAADIRKQQPPKSSKQSPTLSVRPSSKPPSIIRTPEKFELKPKSVTIKPIESESIKEVIMVKNDQQDQQLISTTKIATDDQQQPLFQTRTELPLYLVSSIHIDKSKVSQTQISSPQQQQINNKCMQPMKPKSTSKKSRTTYRSGKTLFEQILNIFKLFRKKQNKTDASKSTFGRFERSSIFYRRLDDYKRDRREEAIMIPYQPYLKGRPLYTIHSDD
ncbi:hypothetical protein BLA29_006705, partial [Euroglyphus maynei]